jgi:hypothetical protein
MRAHDVPVTRENCLVLAYPGGPPEPWPAELEVELPVELQQWEGM